MEPHEYGDLANYVPDDLADLEFEVEYSIEQTRERLTLLRSFFMRLSWSCDALPCRSKGQSTRSCGRT